MKRKIITIVMLGIAGCLLWWGSGSAGDKNEDAAVKAAYSWLTLIDNGDYTESWRNAAEYFRIAVPVRQWERSLSATREPLGRVLMREVKSREYRTSLPGAPDGKYVVIEFVTSFSNKKNAIETVTPMMEKNGVWRVSGYYIR